MGLGCCAYPHKKFFWHNNGKDHVTWFSMAQFNFTKLERQTTSMHKLNQTSSHESSEYLSNLLLYKSNLAFQRNDYHMSED